MAKADRRRVYDSRSENRLTGGGPSHGCSSPASRGRCSRRPVRLRRRRDRHRRRRARRLCDRPGADRRDAPGRGPAARRGAAIDGRGRRAAAAPIRHGAAGRYPDLGDALAGGIDHKQAGRQRRRPEGDGIQLFRQFRRRAVRGRNRGRAPRLGRRARTRSHQGRDAGAYGQGRSGTGSADLGQAGCGQHAGLSRRRLCGFRAPAAERLWQPHSATAVRSAAAGRRTSPQDKGRGAYSGVDRIRTRSGVGHEARASRRGNRREPAHAVRRNGSGRLAGRASDAVSEPGRHSARRFMVRR